MIDPARLTNFDATDHELEGILLFAIAAAGHGGHQTAGALDRFLEAGRRAAGDADLGPFDVVRRLTVSQPLWPRLRDAGLGCYHHRERAFRALVAAGLELRTCTLDDLEALPGIGMKTSRLFVLHTRRDARCIPLDTHWRKVLAEAGVRLPRAWPPASRREYLRLETAALALCDAAGVAPHAYDLDHVWNRFARAPRRDSVAVRASYAS